MKGRVCLFIAVGLLVISFAGFADAADTTETFDVGATDFEFYLGMDGFGLEKYEKSIYSEVLAGFGLMDRFSGYIAASGGSNEYFLDGSGAMGFGIFGTPVDTDHFDLDLFLDAGFGADEFAITPAMELNFDLKPDLSLWGVYFRVEQSLAGRDTSTPDDPATPSVNETETSQEYANETGLTAGTYFTIAEIHQILVEYNMSFRNNPDEDADEDDMEIGSVALGYNVGVSDAVEWVSQVSYDIPQTDDEDPSWGIMTGIVVTMPAGGK